MAVGMGWRSGAVLVVLWTLLPACRSRTQPKGSTADQLEFVIGGKAPRLRERLGQPGQATPIGDSKAGNPKAGNPKAGNPKADSSKAKNAGDGPPSFDTRPRPLRVPAQQPRQVKLQKGETIYGIAKRELGDASRWRDIVELNGWLEEELGALPPGTVVRLPHSSR